MLSHRSRVCARPVETPSCVRRGLPVHRLWRPRAVLARSCGASHILASTLARTRPSWRGGGEHHNTTRAWHGACGVQRPEGEARGLLSAHRTLAVLQVPLSLSRTGRARVVWCVLLRARQRWFGIVPRWWAAGTACVVAHDPLNRAAAPHATPALLPHRVPTITIQTRLVYLAILAGWQQACMVCTWTAVVQH